MGCIYGNEQEESLGSMDILPLTEPTSLIKVCRSSPFTRCVNHKGERNKEAYPLMLQFLSLHC